MNLPDLLIVFTRYPAPGRVKTRLIPALGAAGAARLHGQLAERTMQQIARFRGRQPVALEVRYTGGSRKAVAAWLGPWPLRPQGKGGLGERLCRALAAAFAQGRERVVMVGTDCPGLTPAVLTRAFDALTRQELVLGPAADGGYYLVGLRRFEPGLFEGISWGTPAVLAETLTRAAACRLPAFLLEPLADVDRPEDLASLRHHSGLQ